MFYLRSWKCRIAYDLKPHLPPRRPSFTFTVVRFAAAVLRRRPLRRPHPRRGRRRRSGRVVVVVSGRRGRSRRRHPRVVPGAGEGRERPRHPEQAGRRPRELQEGRPGRPGGEVGRRRGVQLERRRQHPRLQHHGWLREAATTSCGRSLPWRVEVGGLVPGWGKVVLCELF